MFILKFILKFEDLYYACYTIGPVKSWEPHEKLPPISVRDLFTRFLDITTPPTTILLQYLATTCDNEEERKQLSTLATVGASVSTKNVDA